MVSIRHLLLCSLSDGTQQGPPVESNNRHNQREPDGHHQHVTAPSALSQPKETWIVGKCKVLLVNVGDRGTR